MAPQYAWSVAFARFGYGARPGGEHKGDPKGALLAELATAPGAVLAAPELRSTPQIAQDIFAHDMVVKAQREAAPMGKSADLPKVTVGAGMMQETQNASAMTPEQPPQRKAFFADVQARVERAYSAPIGFVERLVAFWSNHFCVSVAKSEIDRGTAGAFEREAIRPHVLGRFADMLLAVEQHPAMLIFLDNQQSIGPNSPAGRNNKKGLNENLAREILELHTMGVGSGYSQADVTQLANILTGWTYVGQNGKLGEPGSFVFNSNAHEPSAATVLGRTYAQDDVSQGEAALADLAREAATARHIAFKFARHFVADAPDSGLVQRLAEVFRRTDGDLAALARALVEDPVAWSAPRTKIRNPWEMTVAAYRAFAHEPADPRLTLNALNLLGMPLWQPAGPNGFSDEAAAWTSPEGMKTRVELAIQFARQIKDAPRPMTLVDDILGPDVSAATREAVMHAESQEQAYALLIMSPEFQRR